MTLAYTTLLGDPGAPRSEVSNTSGYFLISSLNFWQPYSLWSKSGYTSAIVMSHTPPRVFVSYAQESEQLFAWVLQLADRLRDDGVDCRIDQYGASPRKAGSVG
jgi:hypothetical protein